MTATCESDKWILGEQIVEPIDRNSIPPITDPLGKHWRQPDMSQVLIDDDSAIMSKAVFDELAEYSTSMPSGVYPGKCWKREEYIMDKGRVVLRTGKWWLCWYGLHEDPKFVSNNFRKILFV